MSGQQLQQAVRKILESSGTLFENEHFVYVSGDHGSGWVAKDLINLRPELACELERLLAVEIQNQGIKPDLISGPAIGGVIGAHYTALAFGSRSVLAERVIDAEGKTLGFEVKRGYDEILKDQSVLIVDDIVNTGFSVRLTYDAVMRAGARPLGIAAYVNRGNVNAQQLGVNSFIFPDQVFLPAWPAEGCPLCKSGAPIYVGYAHRAEFVNKDLGAIDV